MRTIGQYQSYAIAHSAALAMGLFLDSFIIQGYESVYLLIVL